MSRHHGEWQAQGRDIGGRGHRVAWGQERVPTKTEGTTWLQAVLSQCTASERDRRERRALRDAERFLRRCPPEGYPTTSEHFYARCDSHPDARIDLEIYGLAFCGERDDS